MSYSSLSIKKAIAYIDQNKMYLPALQRKFVWGKGQIELLFDSLMRNYPIGTFLFWKLHKRVAKNYVFYDFLKEYDQRSPFNRQKTGSFTHEEIIGVLDGQQRLSSMYIGFMGTHTTKDRWKRHDNDNAYKAKSLYLNLLSLPFVLDGSKITINEQENFEFKFLTEIEAKSSHRIKKSTTDNDVDEFENLYWFKVSDALEWDEDFDNDEVYEVIQSRCSETEQLESVLANKKQIKKGLNTLHSRIFDTNLLSYFEIAKDDLEDILKIFIRVNSGGTVLNKTDLLFSTIVATWDDGREKIEATQKQINAKGDTFNFGTEFLMRSCLVLTDAPVAYKVNSFKSENVLKIQNEWENISKAIDKCVELLAEFGFNGSLLTSQNAVILIAYYIYKGGDLGKKSIENIRKYLIHALLNRIYSSSQESLLSAFRNGIREVDSTDGRCDIYRLKMKNFDFEGLLKIKLPSRKTLAIADTDLDSLLMSKKGSTSFFLLSLLYPQLRYQDQSFDQDHIHPAAGFKKENLLNIGIPEEQHQLWMDYRDTVPNLQLLNDRWNKSKNAKPIKEWLETLEPAIQRSFKVDNYFPHEVSLDFRNFMEFFEKRKIELLNQLNQVLEITNTSSAPAVLAPDNDEVIEE
ncbi:DUF262 domain-containing protein [Pseudoalteromonas sp.]|uniref:DUF262 domain-containing protein n=1 Tax=Pseudoalteromonas sp. TaxID=53249 RepID=UPI0035C6EC9F